jgi:hypothetical protein
LSEYKKEFPKAWADSCRRVYVKDTITLGILDAWFWIAKYELSVERKEEPTNQVYIKEKLDETLGNIRKMLKVLYWRERLPIRGSKGTLTRSDIQTARGYDFKLLLPDLHNNQCLCPFHNDTQPSMVYNYKRNVVRCFSCNKSWDTIQYVMDKEGLTFPQAVRKLI